VEIREEPLSVLDEYAEIPMAFEVRTILEPAVIDAGLGGIGLREVPVDAPYVKDYAALPGNMPADWAKDFDLAHWSLVTARTDGRLVGGIVIAFDTPGVHMLEGRGDLAVLWDVRVEPAARRQGVGAALFTAVERWAKDRGCVELKVETQNVNVPACRFYAQRGCTLRAVDRSAYPELPGEAQLLWSKRI